MTSFEELGINESLIRGVQELGFESPMAIQEKVIPLLLSHENDLIANAQTGTGKTGAFGLPLIQRTDIANKSVQVLILSPTRELCRQIASDLKKYAKYVKGLRIVSVYGGADISRQMKQIEKGAHIIVATPGRMDDLLNRRNKIDLSKLRYLVLDEADEMLSMGFKDELDAILDRTPGSKTTLLFSATMPAGINNIIRNYLVDPIEVSTGERNSGAENVEHIRYSVHEKNRYEALKRIVDFNPDIYGIIFCRTREETKTVAKKLVDDGYSVDALHGDLSQIQRENVMYKFRTGHIQILTATDVAARGLDIKELTHIINYNLPDEPILYIHRSGRTGRAGRKGISIAITNLKEKQKVARIEKLLRKKFELNDVPGGDAICERQLYHIVDKLEKIDVNHHEIDRFLPGIYERLSGLDRDTLIKHFVALEFNRFLDYYSRNEDLEVPVLRKEKRQSSSARTRKSGKRKVLHAAEPGFSRFYMNLGQKHKLTPPDLIGLVIQGTRRKNIDIGKIDILKNFSFFEVDELHTNYVIKGFKKMEFNGVQVNVELTRQNPEERVSHSVRKKKKRKKRPKHVTKHH